MIEVKYITLVNTKNELLTLSKNKIPGTISLKLSSALKEIDKQLEILQETHKNVVTGIMGDNAQEILAKEKKTEEEIAKLKETETELNKVYDQTVNLDIDKIDIEITDEISIAPYTLNSSDWLCNFKEKSITNEVSK